MSLQPLGTESEWLDSIITKSPIVVLSKSFCPYCTSLKEILNKHNASYTVYELDQMNQPKNGPVQQVLGERYGEKSVPQIFLNGEWSGVYEDVEELEKEGKFLEKLKNLVSVGVTLDPNNMKMVVYNTPEDGPQPKEITGGDPLRNVRWFKDGKRVERVEVQAAL